MWVRGIKEGTCYDEHWVIYVSDESLNSTPETDGTAVTQLTQSDYIYNLEGIPSPL